MKRLVLSTVCGLAMSQSAITPPPGLTYTDTYNVQVNNTLASIADAVGRGVCALARSNRMADVELMPRVGSSMRIPATIRRVRTTPSVVSRTCRAASTAFMVVRMCTPW
jgi:hypothetical protein